RERRSIRIPALGQGIGTEETSPDQQAHASGGSDHDHRTAGRDDLERGSQPFVLPRYAQPPGRRRDTRGRRARSAGGALAALGTHSEVRGLNADPARHMIGLTTDDITGDYTRL